MQANIPAAEQNNAQTTYTMHTENPWDKGPVLAGKQKH